MGGSTWSSGKELGIGSAGEARDAAIADGKATASDGLEPPTKRRRVDAEDAKNATINGGGMKPADPEDDVDQTVNAWKKIGLIWNNDVLKKKKCVRKKGGRGSKSSTETKPKGNIKNFIANMSKLKELGNQGMEGRKRSPEDDLDNPKAPEPKKVKVDQKYGEIRDENLRKMKRGLKRGAQSFIEEEETMQIVGGFKPLVAGLYGIPMGIEGRKENS